MHISYDREADAVAIWFEGVKSCKTIDAREDILVDLDDRGRLAGVEILHASEKASLADFLNISIEFQNNQRLDVRLPNLVGV